jgi:IclR family transcriptional regulator, acetate operon repressor
VEQGFVIRNSSGTIAALDRGLSILEELAEAPGLGLTELAQRLGVPKGSLHRHLAALERHGYVTRSSETKRYSLGPRLIHLGYSARSQLKLGTTAQPLMAALRDRFNETVHLGVFDGDRVTHVHAVVSRHPLKMDAAVGEPALAHVSALGKALLGWGPPGRVDEVAAHRGLPRLTEDTLVTQDALEADLELSRERGFTLDNEESAIGLRCVGAPVRDASGDVVAALSLSAPAQRLPLDAVANVAPAVQETANAISHELGWRDGRQTRRVSARGRSNE